MSKDIVVEAWAGETFLDTAHRALQILKLCGNQKVFVEFNDHTIPIDSGDGVVSLAKKWAGTQAVVIRGS